MNEYGANARSTENSPAIETTMVLQVSESITLRKSKMACEFLMQRTCLMRELADALEQATRAVADSNLVRMMKSTRRQQEIVHAIRDLDAQARQLSWHAPLQTGLMKNAMDTDLQKHTVLMTELSHVQAQVVARNRLYAALLRRSRQAVDIFARLLAVSGRADGTYTVPGDNFWPTDHEFKDQNGARWGV